MKLIKTFEATLNEGDICSVLDVYEFALSEGYKVNEGDISIIKEMLKVDYVRESSCCYPILYGSYFNK